MEKNVPDDWFGDLLLFLSCFLDQAGEVSLRCVFHEEIEIIFVAIKHARHEFNDVGVVQTGQDADLVGRIVSLVFAHAETVNLI